MSGDELVTVRRADLEALEAELAQLREELRPPDAWRGRFDRYRERVRAREREEGEQ